MKIGNLDISSFKVGGADCSIYLGDTKLYPSEEPTPPTPSGNCYEIIPQPISQYASTTYDSVYSWSDAKWYMKNNLSQYEKYGIYEVGTSLSDFTYYPNKLVAIGETEYQYQTNGWVEVGEYIDAQTTYEVTDDSTALQGKELTTTFKIPYADVEALGGWLSFRIRTSDDGDLKISTSDYSYEGSASYDGTVTNDGEYYYYSLPSEAPSSVIIQEIQYWDSTPIHLIAGSNQATVEYAEKTTPSSALTYSSVADMEAVSCPTVGVGQYCYTNGQTYKFTSNEEWVQDSNTFVKHFKDDGTVGVLPCGFNNNVLDVGILGNIQGTIPSYDPTLEVVIGDCVTSIGEGALYGLRNMSACTISSGVTSIGAYAFYGCRSLTSITVEALTPPTLGTGDFNNTNCLIYVPSQSVRTYKSANNWKTYASRIQAIPT